MSVVETQKFIIFFDGESLKKNSRCLQDLFDYYDNQFFDNLFLKFKRVFKMHFLI